MFNWLKKLWVKITEFFTKKPTSTTAVKSQSAKTSNSMTKEEFDKLKVAVDENNTPKVMPSSLNILNNELKKIRNLELNEVMIIQKDCLTIYCLRTSNDKVTIKTLSTGDPFYTGRIEINNTYIKPLQRYHEISSQVTIEKKRCWSSATEPSKKDSIYKG